MKSEISPEEALQTLIQDSEKYSYIDVRSEGEFLEGQIPGFNNAPILNNEERSLVGISYKNEGNEKATALGYELTRSKKAERVNQWVDLANRSQSKVAIVSCWRGGQRSKIACNWLEEKHQPTLRVVGGYKAMRALLLSKLESLPNLIVISGLTGSGKTKFIHQFPKKSIDLESHAHHRGSTFGIQPTGTQPKQATFENRVFLDFMKGQKELLIEDESIRIGQVQIPIVLKSKMIASPVVWLETSTEERCRSIAHEYVIDLIKEGFESEFVFKKLSTSIALLRKKLGSDLTSQLQLALKKAFDTNPTDTEAHFAWIEPLLTRYYDKLYHYSFNRNPRTVLFKGNQKECTEWIQNRLN